MPLSEHEQHLLEQMEQALYAEDPKFASQMGASARARMRRRIIIGVVVAIVGLVLVVLGVMHNQTWIGGAGFAIMVAGAGYAISPPRQASGPGPGAVGDDGTVRDIRTSSGRKGKKGTKPRGPSRASRGSFMQRMEARWEHRRDDWH